MKKYNQHNLPTWKKQTGDLIDFGGPEIVEYDHPPFKILGADLPTFFGKKGDYKIVIHDHKIIFNGYEILFSDIWNNLPKEGEK